MEPLNATLANSMERATIQARKVFAPFRPTAIPMSDLGFVIEIGALADQFSTDAAKIGFDAELKYCPMMLVKGSPLFVQRCLAYATGMINHTSSGAEVRP